MASDDQLQKLQERKAKIEEKIKAIRAREASAKRKQNTRRKILVGSVILEMVKSGEEGWTKSKLLQLLDAKLTRAADRKVFDLDGGLDGGNEEDG